MKDLELVYTLKFWPTPQDYNEAVQNPAHNFSDGLLQAGKAAQDSLGLPRPVTGAFASVYRFHCSSKDWAVRCFLHDIPDQAERYKLISDFVCGDTLPYTVDFEFLNDGIQVNGRWFPLLKMQWVSGETLDQYVERHLQDSLALAHLSEKFKQMHHELLDNGIAHGDLQHGNIIVSNGELVLVDYDGMYVPSMSGMTSHELGHRNYQHPKRGAADFGPNLDNFSAWVIFASLRGLAVDPSLYKRLGGGQDCLLFRGSDFENPLRSKRFAAFENHANEELRKLGRFLRWQLQLAPDAVPPLTDVPADIPELPAIPDLPDWMSDEPIMVRPAAPHKQPAAPHKQPKKPHQPPKKPYQPSPITPPAPKPADIPQELLRADSPRKIQWSLTRDGSTWAGRGLITTFMLLVAAPYAVFATFLGSWLGLLFPICLWINWLIWREPFRHCRLARTGKATVGTVTYQMKSSAESLHPGNYYRFDTTYQFEANLENGTRTTITGRFHEIAQNARFGEGDQVVILYDEHNPNNNVIYDLSYYRAV